MIDCRALTLDTAVLARCLWLASRPPWTPAPLALRVTDAQMAALDIEVIEGVAYLGDVPVTTGETQPPPRPRAPVVVEPVVEPVVVDLVALKAQRKNETRDELWSYVDSKISPREREAMIGLFLAANFTLTIGGHVNQWALGVLVFCLDWCKGGMRQQEAVLTPAIDAATDVDGVAAVVPDFDALGPPPAVTAGQIEVMLTVEG